MPTPRSRESIFRLDPQQLRTYRQQRGMSQAELARATGFTEDYIYRIEHGLNEPHHIETIVRFASALACPIIKLIVSEATDPADVDEVRQRVLDIPPEILLAYLAAKRAGQITLEDVYQLVESTTKIRLSNELEDELDIGRWGLWHKAEDKALSERRRYPRGSREWAQLTLRHCAWMCQQAGSPTLAEAYIAEVEHYYPPATAERAQDDPPDPLIRAQIALQRAWIQQQQYADYGRTVAYLTTAARLAMKAGDQHTLSTAHALRYCLEMERAQSEGNAWLGAVPAKPLHPDRFKPLVRSFQQNWHASYYLAPDNPHNYYQQFVHWNLCREDEGRQRHTRERLLRIGQDTNTEHIVYLHLARHHFSQQEWGHAEGFATDALYGYAQAGFPLGIAFAAAIGAEAKTGTGLRSDDDVRLVLDLWMLVLLCHGYPTHYLGRLASFRLTEMVRYLAQHQPALLHSYCQTLNARVLASCKDGVFTALAKVRPEALMESPARTPPTRTPADYLLSRRLGI